SHSHRQLAGCRVVGILPAATAAGVSGAAAAARQCRHLAPKYRPRGLYLRAAEHLPASARGSFWRCFPFLADRQSIIELGGGLPAARPGAVRHASLSARGAVPVALS